MCYSYQYLCGSKHCYCLHVLCVHFEVHTSRNDGTRVSLVCGSTPRPLNHYANGFDTLLGEEKDSQGTRDTEKPVSLGSE